MNPFLPRTATMSRLLTIAAAILAGLSLSSCHSKPSYDELQAQLENAQGQVGHLKRKLEQVAYASRDLQAAAEQLHGELARAQSSAASYEAQAAYDDAESAAANLQAAVDELTAVEMK
jgi:outer membrane murein-binding lipoprotein Lpp